MAAHQAASDDVADLAEVGWELQIGVTRGCIGALHSATIRPSSPLKECDFVALLFFVDLRPDLATEPDDPADDGDICGIDAALGVVRLVVRQD